MGAGSGGDSRGGESFGADGEALTLGGALSCLLT